MRRLSTLQLVPGMKIARDVFSFNNELLLSRGMELTDKAITKLDLYGILTVYVEEVVPVKRPVQQAPKTPSYSERLKQTPEFKEFKKEYILNVDSFRHAINNVVERNIDIDVDTLLNNSLSIIAKRNAQLGILDMLQNMREYDDSTYTHCMNVALISNILATWLKFPQEEVELATACGLFHDIGKMLIPHDIISKPGKLSMTEYDVIKKHPLTGYQLLQAQKLDEHICNAALMHHERNDGTGYPVKLAGQQIDKFARIVAIADVYDAMTASRCYRGPLCPFHVIEIFEAEGFRKYDVEYLLPFLEHVVNTYIQNRCRLSDGRDGDIIYINKDKLSRPIVQCGTEYINLAERPDLTITELL